MYEGYRIVAVTPAGRKRYIEILSSYITKCDLIDEWQIWQNTTNINDIQYFHLLSKNNKKVNVYTSKKATGSNRSICFFFKYAMKEDAIYIRLDDDIVWMEEDSIKELIKFRLNNISYFLVYGNIINNSICDHIQQRIGNLDKIPNIGYSCMDENGWGNSKIAYEKHMHFIQSIKTNDLDKYKFKKWVLNYYERCSINVISWFGYDFAKFAGKVEEDEELFLSVDKPKSINRFNSICGTALFSHFAFYTQREYLDKTNLLDKYKEQAQLKNKDNFFIQDRKLFI